MTLTEAQFLLKGLKPQLLAGLSHDEQAALFETAKVRTFDTDSLITTQGFPAKHIALLVRGRARFSCSSITGRKLNLHWIFPGEICGLAALLEQPRDYLLSAEVVRPITAIVWGRSAIRAFAAKCPRIVDNGLTLAYEYIRLYQATHICSTGRTARQRVALALGTMAEGIGRKGKNGIEIDVRNEDLAHEANVTIFTASRLLNQWQRDQILVKTRGKIVVRSREGLQQRAS